MPTQGKVLQLRKIEADMVKGMAEYVIEGLEADPEAAYYKGMAFEWSLDDKIIQIHVTAVRDEDDFLHPFQDEVMHNGLP